MNRSDFAAELDRLTREYAAQEGSVNLGSYRCEGCVRCASCMFCTGCEECYRCTHCEGCQACTECSHSFSCGHCHRCAYCIESQHCTDSAYLIRCQGCADCTYCFGCVGLVKKEFHILNVPYARTQYFEIVKKLRAELGISQGG